VASRHSAFRATADGGFLMNRIIYRIVGMALFFMAATANCAHSQKVVFYSLKNSKTRISIAKGDITKQRGIDVIVNAANEQLQHGGGVAAAISKAAGPQLQNYCNKLPIAETWGCPRCPTGCALLTPAFNLKSIGIKGIIHTVGPRIAQKKSPTIADEKLLYAAYTNSLQLAAQNKMRSIAFPAISTAIFNYDIKHATPVAIRAVYDFIKNNPHTFDEVRFVLVSGHNCGLYEHVVKKLLYKKAHAHRAGKPDGVINKKRSAQAETQKHEKNKIDPVVAPLTWSQWVGEHPYITATGSVGLVGLIYGVYSIYK